MKKSSKWESIKAWFGFLVSEEVVLGPKTPILPDGAQLIAQERRRQTRNGYDVCDGDYKDGQLALAAVAYATPVRVVVEHTGADPWPWGTSADKRTEYGRLRQLIIAGALIAAEIDRLQRPAPKPPKTVGPSYDDGTEWGAEKKWGGEIEKEPPRPIAVEGMATQREQIRKEVAEYVGGLAAAVQGSATEERIRRRVAVEACQRRGGFLSTGHLCNRCDLPESLHVAAAEKP